ncbi:hypothetical protein EVAR_82687_1 [Eumeta japonica]|uniref:Uncharacterized protein n=1 Tax=Eumeta variegata TaxID=151549 RepID=A0A4C1VBT5_EUMVA|nr:hypothetical protein EVAR_82687_1 [Eumeta japonica]
MTVRSRAALPRSHYGITPEVTSRGATRALQITALQLPDSGRVSRRWRGGEDVPQKKCYKSKLLIIVGHGSQATHNGRVMTSWKIIICIHLPQRGGSERRRCRGCGPADAVSKAARIPLSMLCLRAKGQGLKQQVAKGVSASDKDPKGDERKHSFR